MQDLAIMRKPLEAGSSLTPIKCLVKDYAK